MSRSFRLSAILLSLCLYSAAAQCGSTSLLSISDSLSASVEGFSKSLSASSKGAAKVVKLDEGDYRVVEVADAGRKAQVRLTLVPADQTDTDQGFYLTLRADQLARTDVRRDAIVSVRARPYGVAVFDQGSTEAFALVLDESWTSRIDPAPVTL